MCGIFGLISNNIIKINNLDILLKTLNHRGPDDKGLWMDTNLGIYLGHTRLSILDLSRNGSQPMISKNNRYIISYNGEIYNHLKIREKIKIETNFDNWISSSDTETLIVAIEKFGISKTLSLISGMFAFAIWDRKDKNFILVRDRAGEKPLYYGYENNTFMFGSELSVFKKSNLFKCTINKNSLSTFMKYGYVPMPNSIYDNIYKLKPGSYLKIKYNNISFLEPKEYWSIKSLKKEKYHFNQNFVLKKFEDLLSSSINEQKISDVPLGVFLSSGFDSSLIAAIFQSQSVNKIDTFTIGFEETEFNEAVYAKQISKHIGSNHNELIINSNNIHSIISKLNNVYQEPFADSSQIPTLLLSQYTKQKVKVCLTGDGADELFGGYNRYIFENRINYLPYFIKYLIKINIGLINNETSINFLKKLGFNYRDLKSKLSKLSSILLAKNSFQRYDILTSSNESYLSIMEDCEINESNKDFWNNLNNKSSSEKMMILDFLTYLPDDILCKVDRATMSTSLENRSPFLNKDLIEFAFNLPINYKIRGNQNKWIIRELSNKFIPKKYMNRPKNGFAIPLANWLRTSLREWADELIHKESIIVDQYLNKKKIIQIWNNHLNLKEDNQALIWNLLMILSWQQND